MNERHPFELRKLVVVIPAFHMVELNHAAFKQTASSVGRRHPIDPEGELQFIVTRNFSKLEANIRAGTHKGTL